MVHPMKQFRGKEGSDCDSVGRAVASNTRGLLFESSQLRNFKMNIEKTKIKKNSPGMAHFFKKRVSGKEVTKQ